MKVWLADLTYAQQSIASDFVPAAIGMIAEYLEKKIPKEGISRTLTKIYVRKFLRAVDDQDIIENITFSDTNRRWGGEVAGI